MGCGASSRKNAPVENTPVSGLKDLAQVTTAAKYDEKRKAASSESMKRWIRLQGAVHSQAYAAWDNIDLPIESESDKDDDDDDSLYDTFDEEQSDYGIFLKEDYAKCDTAVVWNDKLLAKLEKDKSARGDILRDAKAYGDTFEDVQDRHITVIYNPVGGGGKARKLVGHMVVPVLQLCKLKFTIMPTKYRRHAVEIMQNFDMDSTNAVIVCGGDGLVHEVVTGYFLHPKLDELKDRIPVGITPCGTANAMANALHTHKVRTQIAIVGRAALAACKGHTKKVDVIKCVQTPPIDDPEKITSGDNDTDHDEIEARNSKRKKKRQTPLLKEREEVYALSCFGWGMAGAVALKADKLRWIPGQKSMRYDIAGFVSLISDWPIADKGILEYREADGSPEGAPWKSTEISLINLICTNLDKQGKKYPIYPGVLPNDGRVVLSYITSKVGRRRVVKLGLGMKKGKWLGMQKDVRSFSLKEFKIHPIEFQSPYCIDGDPHDVSDIHVTCLERALSLFYIPPEDSDGLGPVARMEKMPRASSEFISVDALPRVESSSGNEDTDDDDDNAKNGISSQQQQ